MDAAVRVDWWMEVAEKAATPESAKTAARTVDFCSIIMVKKVKM